MNWKKYYNERLVSATDAVKIVKSGDRIASGHAAAEPKELLDALISRKHELKHVEIWQGVNLGAAPYCNPALEENFRVNTTFVSRSTQDAYWNNRATFTPLNFHQYPKAIKEEFVTLDVLFTTVSPPNSDGYVSLGTSVDHTYQMIKSAKKVVVAVNPNMPFTCGETTIHVSNIDYFVEVSTPLYEIIWPRQKDDTISKIGKNVANLINDGDTLQLGTGSIPNAILEYLYDKVDLGIHTEVFSDNLIPLIEAGIITGKNKSLHNKKIVATFVQGSQSLYEYVHNNTDFHLMPVDYVNDPFIISQNKNMIAINAALEIDLYGQVAAESLGSKQYSGIGGQVDFLRGAARSKNGKPIITLPSTAKNGEISRISACFKPGTPITTSRNDIHYVVTEYGSVNLFGKSLPERAKLLISISHPKFRQSLEKEYSMLQKTGYNSDKY